MRVSASMLVALTCAACLALSACGDSNDAASTTVAQTPIPAPEVELTSNDKKVWAPLPPDRSEVPVLVYHGIGPVSDFSNKSDAEYGLDADDFAKQMTLLKYTGYQTIDLTTFVKFLDGDKVDLPPRPLLLTFDDARLDSWTGADAILQKLRFNAVMFVDVGRVAAGNPEYLSWEQLQTMQKSGRWDSQLHAGKGHVYIKLGLTSDDTGPYYANKAPDEKLAGWRKRVRTDIEWGQQQLADHIPGYKPLAFSPPFGAYGQDGDTNDSRIPGDLLGWLSQRYDAIFTQDQSALVRPHQPQPLGRTQLTRATTGGELHSRLLSGEN